MASFISYSRADQALVKPLVLLLRTSGDEIFCDQDSIPPGKKWRNHIEAAICDSDKMIVFWSANSSGSSEVTFELEFAIEREKDIVPVLLDDTRLDVRLQPYQWIDARAYAQRLKPELPETTILGFSQQSEGRVGSVIGSIFSGILGWVQGASCGLLSSVDKNDASIFGIPPTFAYWEIAAEADLLIMSLKNRIY